MAASPLFPSLYQINTRAWLTELSQQLSRPASLDDIPEAGLDRIAERGFDWVWFLGVWQTGPTAQAVSRGRADWRVEFLSTLPDLSDTDITGSPFAIRDYAVHADFGGDAALARLRKRLSDRGLLLMLDFVPNHTAPDHRWVQEHPEYYVLGTEDDAQREPQNYCRMATGFGSHVYAFGRDPYFPGWADTLQLNYRSLKLRQAMSQELLRVADRCDGVRCDMAMLLLPDVIHHTWGEKSLPADGTPPVDSPFWPEAIERVRSVHNGFKFMAEVYWDMEWTLQQQGFDYTYDKRLYDRLHCGDAAGVRGHLHADAEFQRRSARFLENHDEPRAASAFPLGMHQAAAMITFFIPGLRFFHEGQFEGWKMRLSMHLGRRPVEVVTPELQEFYTRLLEVLKRPEVRNGNWRFLDCRAAWEGNGTWDRIIVGLWSASDGALLLTCVNYGPLQAQCRVTLPVDCLRGKTWWLRDLFSTARYEWHGDDLTSDGLYLDMRPWQFHAFEFQT